MEIDFYRIIIISLKFVLTDLRTRNFRRLACLSIDAWIVLDFAMWTWNEHIQNCLKRRFFQLILFRSKCSIITIT